MKRNRSEILIYLDTQADTPYASTLSEIASAVGISIGTVQYHLAGLKEDGLISKRRNTIRTIRITQQGRDVVKSLKRD